MFSLLYILLNQVGEKSNKYTCYIFMLFQSYIYGFCISYFLYILFFILILVGALSVLRVSITIQIFIYLLAFIIIKISGVKLYIFNVFGWVFFPVWVLYLNKIFIC